MTEISAADKAEELRRYVSLHMKGVFTFESIVSFVYSALCWTCRAHNIFQFFLLFHSHALPLRRPPLLLSQSLCFTKFCYPNNGCCVFPANRKTLLVLVSQPSPVWGQTEQSYITGQLVEAEQTHLDYNADTGFFIFFLHPDFFAAGRCLKPTELSP